MTEDNIKEIAVEDKVLASVVGEVLAYVDTDEKGEWIRLTTQSGRVIEIYHNQDCCEHVRIESTEGSWLDLIGKVVVEASGTYVESKGDGFYQYDCTKTKLVFRVDDATVISRWIGESNGYYSESVDFAEITQKQD